MKIDDKIKHEIMRYESMLHHPNDFTMAAVSCLLDESFSETGQSGKVWNKAQIINHFYALQPDYAENNNIVMLDWRFKRVSDEIILLIYTMRKTNLSTKSSTYSLRSSLWKKQSGRWVMVFHQGTPDRSCQH